MKQRRGFHRIRTFILIFTLMTLYILGGGFAVIIFTLLIVQAWQISVQKRLIKSLKESVATRDKVIVNMLHQLSIINSLRILQHLNKDKNGND